MIRFIEIIGNDENNGLIDIDNIESIFIENNCRYIKMKSGHLYSIETNAIKIYETIKQRWQEYIIWKQHNEEDRTQYLQIISENLSKSSPITSTNNTDTQKNDNPLLYSDIISVRPNS